MPSLRPARPFLLCLTLVVSACGTGEGEHARVTVRDPETGAQVALLPFGDVEAGELSTRVFLLNEGPGDVVFESVAWAREPSPHFTYTLEPALPAKALKPWESVQLEGTGVPPKG